MEDINSALPPPGLCTQHLALVAGMPAVALSRTGAPSPGCWGLQDWADPVTHSPFGGLQGARSRSLQRGIRESVLPGAGLCELASGSPLLFLLPSFSPPPPHPSIPVGFLETSVLWGIAAWTAWTLPRLVGPRKAPRLLFLSLGIWRAPRGARVAQCHGPAGDGGGIPIWGEATSRKVGLSAIPRAKARLLETRRTPERRRGFGANAGLRGCSFRAVHGGERLCEGPAQVGGLQTLRTARLRTCPGVCIH